MLNRQCIRVAATVISTMIVAKHDAKAGGTGFAHHQTPKIPLFPPERGLRQRYAPARYSQRIGGSSESTCCRGLPSTRAIPQSTVKPGSCCRSRDPHCIDRWQTSAADRQRILHLRAAQPAQEYHSDQGDASCPLVR